MQDHLLFNKIIYINTIFTSNIYLYSDNAPINGHIPYHSCSVVQSISAYNPRFPIYLARKLALSLIKKMMKAGPLELGEATAPKTGVNRGVSILDLILRLVAIVCTLASAILMGTTNESLPFFTQFIRFRARYNDLPTLTFFVIANSTVCGYLVLSLGLSIFHIMRNAAQGTRILLIFLDTAMLGLLTGGASAAAAIVYLAHEGSSKVNWLGFCRQFNSFCERISGSLIGSFAGILLLILLILLSAVALSRR
ncbi:casparian strip membrane protein 1 [Diospyros lotus]|uniref:casparian strip membrane protein 1 n=1 Tax=Diospyros lotus TaxID=55363 RepID=UPI00225B93E9|nr:casparian strip membrane protein 1 [Diospyros lotus]